ncbi:MAG: hypothetical protein WBQ14_06250 [Gaiellaceae bacterium]
MNRPKLNNESVADQRYYHFVISRADRGSTAKYWRLISERCRVGEDLMPCEGAGPFDHRTLNSSRAYARGAIAEKLSRDRNGLPPYTYDVLAAEIAVASGGVYFVAGFPFASLALQICEEVFGAAGRSSIGQFACADIPKLVTLMEEAGTARSSAVTARIVAVEVSVRGDKSLTMVRLGGDDPLRAELYRAYLQSRIAGGALVPDQCVLACEKTILDEMMVGERHLRSRVHMDRYGNFKFYAHVALANLELLTSTLALLDDLGCLQDAEHNPVMRLKGDEEAL